MIQENKELLFKDLCARLPYDVYVRRYVYTTLGDAIESVELFGVEWLEELYEEEAEFKPYLFPLSSMTEEQWKEYQTLKMTDWVEGDINGVFINAGTITDWLNKNHFDYQGLIEKGLAIDATGLNIY